MRLLLITILGMGSFSLLLCFGLADTARRKKEKDDFAQLGARPLVTWPGADEGGEVERILRIERRAPRDSAPPPAFAPSRVEEVQRVMVQLAGAALRAVVGADATEDESSGRARRSRRPR